MAGDANTHGMGAASVATLVDRLRNGSQRVRRLAIWDLIRATGVGADAAGSGDARNQANRALVDHLCHETDERTLLLIVAHAAEHGARSETGGSQGVGRNDPDSVVDWKSALAQLRDASHVHRRVAHAALLAHDRIESTQRASQGANRCF